MRNVFSILKRNKFLDIIKYNKNFQKFFNININNYKEYTEIYSPIEIEIIPVINTFGKFFKKYSKKRTFHHIYFDDKKEEIKRIYIKKMRKFLK